VDAAAISSRSGFSLPVLSEEGAWRAKPRLVQTAQGWYRRKSQATTSQIQQPLVDRGCSMWQDRERNRYLVHESPIMDMGDEQILSSHTLYRKAAYGDVTLARTTLRERSLVASQTDGQECEGGETPRNRTIGAASWFSKDGQYHEALSRLTTEEVQAQNTNNKRASPSQPVGCDGHGSTTSQTRRLSLRNGGDQVLGIS
jgi:hypothetical protein